MRDSEFSRRDERKDPGNLFGGNPFNSPEWLQAWKEAGIDPFGGSGVGIPLGGLHTAVPPAIASQGVSQTVAGAGGAGAGGLLGALRGLVSSPSDLAALGGILAALAGNQGGNTAFPAATMRGLEEAQGMTNARFRRADPLHEAVTQLAFQRLPVTARNGISLPRVPLPGGGG